MNNEIKEILKYIEQFVFVDQSYNETRLSKIDCKLLLNYITNLQEELKYQKQAEQEYNEKHTKLMKKYKDLQERKDKAIKYLEESNRDNFDYSKAILLEILGDKE